MKRNALVMTVMGALVTAGASLAQAQTAAAWIHVRVEEPHEAAKVSLNLPLAVVQAALALAPEKIASEGRVHLPGHHDLSVSELRKIWNELRNAGDAEIASVQDKDETVKVARVGSLLHIRVEKLSSKETVRVDLPVAVVDALLAGEGQELNVRGALSELQKLRGDVVQVEETDSKVRIWIDERS